MENIQGLLLVGVVRGFRPRTYNNEIQGYELGVSMQKPDGFGSYSEDVKIVRVSENQSQHVQHAANSLLGHTVLISVYESAYANRGGKGIAQLNYVPDTHIIDLDTGVNPFTGEAKTKAA